MRFVFFSFHYKKDVWRANVVRNSWVTKEKSSDRGAEGFIDAASFEKVEMAGEQAVKKWIDNELIGTSVTVVLIGEETSKRKYVKYEIEKSIERGNGLLGIHIYSIENQDKEKGTQGVDPFIQFKDKIKEKGYPYPKIYYWYGDDGYKNVDSWIEDAAKERGK
jgi:hypothetical protein